MFSVMTNAENFSRLLTDVTTALNNSHGLQFWIVPERNFMELQQWFNERQSRRNVLRQLSLLAGASVTLYACAGPNPAPGSTPTPKNSSDFIDHILIVCQENRTFDHYFGHYP